MSDDSPSYSRNIVRRKQVVAVAMGIAFVAVTASVWGGVGWAVHGDRLHDPNDTTFMLIGLATLVGAILAGLLACILVGHFAERLHRSI